MAGAGAGFHSGSGREKGQARKPCSTSTLPYSNDTPTLLFHHPLFFRSPEGDCQAAPLPAAGVGAGDMLLQRLLAAPVAGDAILAVVHTAALRYRQAIQGR